uniref:Tr-type G domain-containing protein n=1 Tax=Ciona savignyi TaxID=51511 RepID=H2ZIC2_CIOSA
FTNLNIGAKPFVPNINAAVFVPGKKAEPAENFPESQEQAPDTNSVVEMTIENPPVLCEHVATEMKGEVPEVVDEVMAEEEPQAKMEEEQVVPVPQASLPEELSSKEEHINVVFIGHVDAGKSTIGGQIMYLTGMVDKRTLEKYEREAKEKNRETWYLWCSQADVAVLVISARRGEFETGFERGGQTREHAMLAKTAGVQHLIVLINKMDDSTVKWSEERYKECKEKLIPFLKKVGFNPKKDIHFMPCSGLTGANLKKSDYDNHPWYTGLPLIPYLDNLPTLTRSGDGPLRLPIVDKYKDMGVIVLGKVESGSVYKGQMLVMQPNRRKVKVLGIQSDEVETELAIAGENVKVRVDSIEEEEISKGFVLCTPDNLCSTGQLFDAQIAIIEYKSIICAGYSAILHIHTCIEEVVIKQLICLLDRKTGEKKKTRFVKQDQTVIARLQTQGPVCIESFKTFPQMGRFTLRDEGRTIAIGKVLKVLE